MKEINEILKEMNDISKDFDNLVSYIYDRTHDEMMSLAKVINASGKDITDTIRIAFEKILDIRYADRIDVYRFYYDEEV